MITSPSRASVDEIGLPGAITPFYRERGINHPEGIVRTPGYNYTPYQPFALRTRMESDPLYANFSNQFSTKLSYRSKLYNNEMTMFLCIVRVPDPDFRRANDPKMRRSYSRSDVAPTGVNRVETVKPEWLQELTDEWVDRYPDYCVVLTDQYPIGIDPKDPLPLWWTNEILPRLNVEKVMRDCWVEGNPNVDLSGYSWFYEDGSVYVRLIDPDNSHNIGEWSPYTGELLDTGDQVIVRQGMVYGDYSDYSKRYTSLQVGLIDKLTQYYHRGVMSLDPVNDSSLIKKWKLIPVPGETNLYEFGWNDIRLTGFDGRLNLLRRLGRDWKNMWDSSIVYYYTGEDRVTKHNVSYWFSSEYSPGRVVQIIGNYIPIRVDSYSNAIEIANSISSIIASSFGTVIRSRSRGVIVDPAGISKKMMSDPNNQTYYDAFSKSFINSQKKVDITTNLSENIESIISKHLKI